MNITEMDSPSQQTKNSNLELNAQETQELQALLTDLNAVGSDIVDSLDRIHLLLQNMVNTSRSARGVEEYR